MIFRLITLSLIASTNLAFSKGEQEILKKRGPESQLVIEKAYEELSNTKYFEFPDVGWGTPSASCWALTVITKYDKVEATRRLEHIVKSSDNTVLKLYALIGLHLIDPKIKKWNPILQDKDFLTFQTGWLDGCTGFPASIEQIIKRILDSGGYEMLLLEDPLPPLYQTRHPWFPPDLLKNNQNKAKKP